jgi:oligosaccharide amylase
MAVVNIRNEKTLAEMPAAITGNSRMLACHRENGELYRLFWPNVDYGQHLGSFWPGIRITVPSRQSRTKWFHLNFWKSSQRYLDNTNILETTLYSTTHHLRVTQSDFVIPNRDILVRNFELNNEGEKSERIAFFVYCNFNIEESAAQDSAYIDYTNESLVFFRRDIYFALGGSGYPLAGYQCGRRGTDTDPYRDAAKGILRGNRDHILQNTGSLSWDLGELKPREHKTITLYLTAGKNEGQVRSLLTEARSQEGGCWARETGQYWHGWLKPVLHQKIEHTAGAFNRSLLAMKLMLNKETGAPIAAPEFDPHHIYCGGYGYCWPRDAVYIAAALDEAGYHDPAGRFYYFAKSVQGRDGSWHQRYFTDGSVAPFWGRQIDQVGSVLWGYKHHYIVTGDDTFLQDIWPSLAAGADYLSDSIQSNGLPAASIDPWEDTYSQGSYSAAAVCAGLKAASDIAFLRGEKENFRHWLAASAMVKEGILKHLWSDRRSSFMRGVNRRIQENSHCDDPGDSGKVYTTKDPAGLYHFQWTDKDARIDAALLGLAYPFAILDPNDKKMAATARAIEEKLWNLNTGGIHRYEGDTYRGGNPWLITTLWLSLYHCLAGNRSRAEELYQWSLAQANQHLLLPEQADKHTGGPAWVMPLNWSHAMFVLTHLALDGSLSVQRI